MLNIFHFTLCISAIAQQSQPVKQNRATGELFLISKLMHFVFTLSDEVVEKPASTHHYGRVIIIIKTRAFWLHFPRWGVWETCLNTTTVITVDNQKHGIRPYLVGKVWHFVWRAWHDRVVVVGVTQAYPLQTHTETQPDAHISDINVIWVGRSDDHYMSKH